MADEIPFERTMEVAYGVAQEVAPGVRRIVANNPGPFTFKGTNTYLIGRREIAVVDPGPADPAHRRAILAAAGEARITRILLTHTHRDHSAGLAPLKAATGASTAGYGLDDVRRNEAARFKEAATFLDMSFRPDRKLVDGDRLEIDGITVTALYTPGHAPDHLCFALEAEGILLSGDHVMGWNTSVVAPPEGRMSDYMASLERLLERPGDRLYLSGHGETIHEPQRLVRSYLVHRRMRDSAILECVRDGLETTRAITERVYRGIDESVLSAARLSTLAHLEHLVERGLVSCDGPPRLESRFFPS